VNLETSTSPTLDGSGLLAGQKRAQKEKRNKNKK
jgi:hypothetical protein